MEEKFFEELKKKVQPYFEKGGSHAFDHTQRVYNLALKIAKSEKIDLDILKTAVILHDIARKEQDEVIAICHAEKGAKMAEKILEKIKFPKDKIGGVLHAIRVHRHSKKLKAETKEAEILQDADRLDALGAITIARMFSTGGKIDRPLHDPSLPKRKAQKSSYSNTTINGFYEKILKIKPETFNTKKAKEIAKERYEFVEQFLDRFLKEWDGKL
jgi:uncharacterized protein